MNLRFLETFVWVARLGSFRATASKLHLTQAAVSGRMSALETDLQTKLFVRQGRQMRLSGAGKTLLHHAEVLLKAEQALRLDLSAPAELRGRVRVGVMETIVYTWFGEFLAQLQAHHPNVELEITVESSRRLHGLLKSGLIDVALQTHPVIDKNIRNAPLGKYQMRWLVAHDAVSLPTTLAEVIQDWSLVTFPRYSQPHLQLLELLEQHGLNEPSRIHFASSIEAALQLLRTGQCIGLMPATLLLSEARRSQFKAVRQLPVLEAMHLVVSWRPEPVYATISTVIDLSLKVMDQYAQNHSDIVTASDGLVFVG